ncbi:MAG: GNAT family N-acetyltransferase [Actinomycetota bacterium]|nr:GNAT family N-acetyltransferase [Actinomycetota bacterium]
MTDWSALDDAGAPLAPHVGPFPNRAFLEAWWRHRGAGTPIIAGAGQSALACVVGDGVVRMAGEGDLTDYHSPLGADPRPAVDSLLGRLPANAAIRFDSLPGEAAEPLVKALAAAGSKVTSAEHDATMVLDLPEHVDAYLGDLNAKQRHEIRRKSRRFGDLGGEAGLRRDESGFRTFVEMHRAAPGDKGAFMTTEMEAFFRDLLDVPGSALDLLIGAGGRPVAAAFGFEDEDAYYLYNSSFDPSAASASPGIVLCDTLIRSAIESGKRRFDFLKGVESYKRRFGATPRPLFAIAGSVP